MKYDQKTLHEILFGLGCGLTASAVLMLFNPECQVLVGIILGLALMIVAIFMKFKKQ